MRSLMVTFNHRIDSKRLYNSLGETLYAYENGEVVSLRVDVTDFGDRVFLLVSGNLANAIHVLEKCWEFAPFELSVGR